MKLIVETPAINLPKSKVMEVFGPVKKKVEFGVKAPTRGVAVTFPVVRKTERG